MRERERRKEERFQALESFLQANTDLSTQRHSWKRNLIREKLNSFKCTSRPLFAPYLPPSSRPYQLLSPLPPYSHSPAAWSLQPPERPTWFLLFLLRCLFLFRPLFRLLLLSATHLYSVNPFHCENVVLQFTLYPHPLPRPPVLPILSRSFSPCFPPFFMHRSRTLQFLVSVLSSRRRCQASFLPLHPPIKHCPLRCSPPLAPPPRWKSSLSTSDCLTPLINSRHRRSRNSAFSVARDLL